MTVILHKAFLLIIMIFFCLHALVQSLYWSIDTNCLRFVEFPVLKWTWLFIQVFCALYKTVRGHCWRLGDDWRLFFWVYILKVLRSVEVYSLMERSLVELDWLHLVCLCEVNLFWMDLRLWLFLVGCRHNFHLDMIRKVSSVLRLVLRTEAIRFFGVGKWDSFGIVSGLIEGRVFGDEGQFIGFDRSLFGEVGAVSGMSDFLDGFILIDVILVWNGKILAKRDH